MEFSVPGFIKRYCGPNALLTFAEYLEDYADENTKLKGYQMIQKKISQNEYKNETILLDKLEKLKNGQRDLYF